jgi:hypothetical protein
VVYGLTAVFVFFFLYGEHSLIFLFFHKPVKISVVHCGLWKVWILPIVSESSSLVAECDNQK